MGKTFLKGNLAVLVKTLKKAYPLAVSGYLLRLFTTLLFNVTGKCSS